MVLDAEPRVIKPVLGSSLAAQATPLNFSQLRSQGDRIIEAARILAGKMLQEGRRSARQEAESIRQEAAETGCREGYRTGTEKGETEGRDRALAEGTEAIRSVCRCVGAAMEQVDGMHLELRRQAESDLLGLAMAIARRVVKSEVSRRSREVARENLSAALELVQNKSALWIHVHPDDATSIQQYLSEVSELLEREGRVKVLADESITRGGVVVRTESGEIDARIQAQLDRLENELLHPTGDYPRQEES